MAVDQFAQNRKRIEIVEGSSLDKLIKSLPLYGEIRHEKGTNFWSVVLNEKWQNKSNTFVQYCEREFKDKQWALDALKRAKEWKDKIENGNENENKKEKHSKDSKNEKKNHFDNKNKDKTDKTDKSITDEMKNNNENKWDDNSFIDGSNDIGWAVPPSMAGLHITLGIFDPNSDQFPSNILKNGRKVSFGVENLTSFSSWRQMPTHLAGQRIDDNGYCFYPTHFIFLDIKFLNGFEFDTAFAPHVSIACIAAKLKAQNVIKYNNTDNILISNIQDDKSEKKQPKKPSTN